MNNLDLITDALRTIEPIVGGFSFADIGYKGANELLCNEMCYKAISSDSRYVIVFITHGNGFHVKIANCRTIDIVEAFLDSTGKTETQWQELIDRTG